MDTFLIAESILALVTICTGFTTLMLTLEKRHAVTSEQLADRIVRGINTLIQSERTAVRAIISNELV